MRSPVPDYLQAVIDSVRSLTGGAVADYIPELAGANPERLAIALATVEGAVYVAGDAEERFSIQSMSKPFTYALAIADRGLAEVAQHIDVEPSGEAFNEISLETGTGRPRNPMINAGAIAAHSLVAADSADQRDARVHDFYSRFAGRELALDAELMHSEQSTGDRNLALGHLLKSFGVIDQDPVAAVNGYIRQCSLTVDVADLALMAATLANGGVQPVTGERLVDPLIVRQVLSVMTTCGMYDAAGDWLTTVGIPAKSGVSGGIIGVLPGQVGIAVFSPRLDSHGNSVRGVAMMERLSRDMNLHIMDAARPARSAIRSRRRVRAGGENATVFELQGDLVFVSTEALIRNAVVNPPDTELVVFDLSRVDEITDVARRMSIAATERLKADGKRVVLVDPRKIIAPLTLPDGTSPTTLDSLEELEAGGSP